MKELTQAVRIMRELQTKYIATRNKKVLALAKQQESIIDKMLEEQKTEKKRVFQILDEMNQNDIEHNTRFVAVSPHFIEAKRIKQGTKVVMGADERALLDLGADAAMAILIIVDKKEFVIRKAELRDE